MIRSRPVQVASAVLFLGLLVAGLLSLILAPKATVAAEENRRLATWPRIDRTSVVAGRYAREVEAFIADHFPLRDRLLLLSDELTRLRGLGTPEIQIFAGAAGMVPTGEAPADSSPPPASNGVASVASESGRTPASPDAPAGADPQGLPEGSTASDARAGEDQAYEWNNSLVIYRGRAIQAFRLPAAASARYARVMTRWIEALGPSVSLFLMPVPVGSDFYLPARVKGPEDHERANIERLVAALPPAVVPVRAYDALSAHRDEPIFFRTDHHWTGRGAYYGYTAFAEAAGIAPLPMSAFTRRTCGRFLGSLYAQTRSPALAVTPDSVEMFLVGNRVEVRQLLFDQRTWQRGALYLGCRGYQSFLGLDYPLMTISSDVGNGRRVLVIKDSYGNAFIPYLAAHYERIWVVDYRYYAGSVQRLIEAEAIDTVIFVHNLQVLNSAYVLSREVALLAGGPPLPLATPSKSDSARKDSGQVRGTPRDRP